MSDNDQDDTWVPDDALEALTVERSVNPSESEEGLARRLFRENAPSAVLGIVHTSKHGTNERTRLDAQKYIVERVLGKIGDDSFGADKSPLETLFDKLDAHANSGE